MLPCQSSQTSSTPAEPKPFSGLVWVCFPPVCASPLANVGLFQRFKVLESLNQDDQTIVIKIIDAMLAKQRMEEALEPVS